MVLSSDILNYLSDRATWRINPLFGLPYDYVIKHYSGCFSLLANFKNIAWLLSIGNGLIGWRYPVLMITSFWILPNKLHFCFIAFFRKA